MRRWIVTDRDSFTSACVDADCARNAIVAFLGSCAIAPGVRVLHVLREPSATMPPLERDYEVGFEREPTRGGIVGRAFNVVTSPRGEWVTPESVAA